MKNSLFITRDGRVYLTGATGYWGLPLFICKTRKDACKQAVEYKQEKNLDCIIRYQK